MRSCAFKRDRLIRRCVLPFRLVALVGVLVMGIGSMASADPIPVKVLQNEDGSWQLLRGGEPYFVKGVGGQKTPDMLRLLKASGGNSIRTYAAGDNVQQILDQAHELGLTVTVGIWMKHSNHGFDYDDPAQVAAQYDRARQEILRYKDHPALLMWCIGNEVDGRSADNPNMWKATNAIAAAVKELDPRHPTMVGLVAFAPPRLEMIRDLCPDIDILGQNGKVGAKAEGIAEQFQKAGLNKPYMLTEYGSLNSRSARKNDFGVKLEETSTEKAKRYRQNQENGILPGKEGMCLGGYAFYWGITDWATASTWFGTTLPTGEKLGAVDVLTEIWTGHPPANRCPTIASIAFDGSDQVEPGARVRASAEVADPEGSPKLWVKWQLYDSTLRYPGGGDKARVVRDAIVQSDGGEVTVQMPNQPGVYRLYAFAYDGEGGAAVANAPILVGSLEDVKRIEAEAQTAAAKQDAHP